MKRAFGMCLSYRARCKVISQVSRRVRFIWNVSPTSSPSTFPISVMSNKYVIYKPALMCAHGLATTLEVSLFIVWRDPSVYVFQIKTRARLAALDTQPLPFAGAEVFLFCFNIIWRNEQRICGKLNGSRSTLTRVRRGIIALWRSPNS